jgi:hypothetical protein
MRARRCFIDASLLAAFLLQSASACAENLLQNGTFDWLNDLDGWVFQSGANLTWDGDGRLHSGSALIGNGSGIAGSYVGGHQCVSIESNTVYALRGYARIPLADAGGSGALINARWTDNPICDVPTLRVDEVLATEIAGSWIAGEATVTSPPEATHVAFEILVHQIGDPPHLPSVNFDDLYVPEPKPMELAGAAFMVLALARQFHGFARIASTP